MKRACEVCGGLYQTYNKDRRFCSLKCRDLAPISDERHRDLAEFARRPRRTRPTKVQPRECGYCGLQYQPERNNRGVFCSKSCGNAGKKRVAGCRDQNEQEIVDALVAAGASVILAAGGGGAPDLIVGYCSKNYLLEIKNPKNSYGRRGQTAHQKRWAGNWKGGPVTVVRTIAEAFAAIGFTALEALPS